MSGKHGHYHKDVSYLQSIDVYRTLELFGVTDQALGHAIKKLLCAGKRGAGKTFEQDVREAVDTLNRRLQMLAEDDNRLAFVERTDLESMEFPEPESVKMPPTKPEGATHYWPRLGEFFKLNSNGCWAKKSDNGPYWEACLTPSPEAIGEFIKA